MPRKFILGYVPIRGIIHNTNIYIYIYMYAYVMHAYDLLPSTHAYTDKAGIRKA